MDQQQLADTPKTPIELKSGPIPNSQRSCTDLICCVIFILFLVGVFGIAIYAFSHGDPLKVTFGYDPDHRACGHDQAVKDYPLIYFVTPKENYEYRTVCVKECPKTATDILKCKPNSLITSCNANLSTDPNQQVIIYPSYPFENKVCIPKDEEKYGDVDKSQEDKDHLQSIMKDLKESRWVILGSVFIAAMLSLLFIYALDKCGGIIVWSSIVLLLASMLIFALVCFHQYYTLHNLKEKNGESQAKEQQQFAENQHNKEVDPEAYAILGVVFGVLFLIMLIVVICYRKTINLAIVVLKTASEFIEDNLSTIMIPICGFIFTLLFFIFWVSSMLYLYTIGDVTKKEHAQPFGQFEIDEHTKYLGYYQLSGLVWTNTFIMASCEFIIIGVVCMWYFQQGKGQEHHSGLTCKSFSRFLRFHPGTTAFGSFLLTVIILIRMALDAAKNRNKGESAIIQFAIQCVDSCFRCLGDLVELVNKNAYVQTNMTGKSFCKAGRDAWQLIARNAMRFSIVLGLGQFLIGIGRLFIAVTTALLCYLIITNINHLSQEITYPMIPAVICFFIALSISSPFMAVYGIAIDAILHLFLIDYEIEQQFGKNQAQFCPPVINKFIQQFYRAYNK